MGIILLRLVWYTKLREYIMKNNVILFIFFIALILGVFLIVVYSGHNLNSFKNIPVKYKPHFNQSQMSGLKWK